MNNDHPHHSHTPPPGDQQPVQQLTPAQLLELASADALGLLDDAERRDFESAFAAASPKLKQLIRDQQLLEARHLMAALPERPQPAALRQTVLTRIFGLLGSERAVAGRIGSSVESSLARSLPPAQGVNHWWRAGAIGAVAASVLLGVISLQLWGQFNRLDEAIRTNTVTEVFAREFGPRFESALLSPQTQFVQFAASSGAPIPDAESLGDQTKASRPGPMAVLLIDGNAGTGQLFCRDLPNARAFTLNVVSADGQVRRAVLTFTPSNARAAVQIQTIDLPPGSGLEVMATESTAPVLKSINL